MGFPIHPTANNFKSLWSLKIDLSPSKRATEFLELSNASVVDFCVRLSKRPLSFTAKRANHFRRQHRGMTSPTSCNRLPDRKLVVPKEEVTLESKTF